VARHEVRHATEGSQNEIRVGWPGIASTDGDRQRAAAYSVRITWS
jgi:hypothetical protein